MSLNLKKIKANFKKATTKKEVNEDLKALIAVPVYLLIPSILKLSGWTGLLASFGLTWGAGAAFDWPSVRRAAYGITAIHLFYAKMSGTFNSMLGVPPWRMGTTPTTTINGLQSNLRGYVARGYENGTINKQPALYRPAEAPVATDRQLSSGSRSLRGYTGKPAPRGGVDHFAPEPEFKY